MHVCASPHDPHTDGSDKHRNAADPMINNQITFDLHLSFKAHFAYQRICGRWRRQQFRETKILQIQ